jgi:threonine/homoserine/homoserine lactone efflux protein
MTLSLDLLLGFALFALVTSITPGPNTMLLASG